MTLGAAQPTSMLKGMHLRVGWFVEENTQSLLIDRNFADPGISLVEGDLRLEE